MIALMEEKTYMG